MREYAKISPKIWISPTGKQIKSFGIQTQLLTHYLISSPHANMIGVYYLPLAIVEHETGLTSKEVNEALHNLIQIEFCSYDKNRDYVWVHNMAFYQIEESLKPRDNRVKNVNDIYHGLPDLDFLPKFFEKYKQAFWLESNINEDSSMPLLSQEHEQEQKHEITSSLREEDVESVCDRKKTQSNCPHEQIIDLYHQVLPFCPRVKIWNPTRQKFLRQRWNESSKHQDIHWWKKFFEYIAESKFLTGKKDPQDGRPPFVANLEWLVRSNNFTKVIEGNYHRGEV